MPKFPKRSVIVKGKEHIVDLEKNIMFPVDSPSNPRKLNEDDIYYFRELFRFSKAHSQ